MKIFFSRAIVQVLYFFVVAVVGCVDNFCGFGFLLFVCVKWRCLKLCEKCRFGLKSVEVFDILSTCLFCGVIGAACGKMQKEQKSVAVFCRFLIIVLFFGHETDFGKTLQTFG